MFSFTHGSEGAAVQEMPRAMLASPLHTTPVLLIYLDSILLQASTPNVHVH
jgi:hypothetical protein